MDIAVVDDEKAIREHICGLVEEQQPESRIKAYATGEELLASGKRFDIVFLDIQMEGMDGIEAAGQSDVSGMSFKDMWQARYPGAYYHVMEVQQYRREHGTGMLSLLKNPFGMIPIHPR